MTSAYASAPPPFRFGRVELRANARKFLERALIISLLVHLCAVGVFRAMERRAGEMEKTEIALTPWHNPVHVTPPIVDPSPVPNTPVDTPDKVGTIVPVEKPNFKISALAEQSARPYVEPGRETGTPSAPSTGGADTPAPPADGPAFTVVADTPPAPTFAPKPVYPEWAREAGVEGKVVLAVLVGKDGVPKRVAVLRGTNGLIEAAVSAAWRWRFSPGLATKKPVEVWVEIPFAFKL